MWNFSDRPVFPPPRDLTAFAPLPSDFQGHQTVPTMVVARGSVSQTFRRSRGKFQKPAADTSNGPRGDVYLTASADDGQSFGPPRMVAQHIPGETNEHDALILRHPNGRAPLVTRPDDPKRFLNRIQRADRGGQGAARVRLG